MDEFGELVVMQKHTDLKRSRTSARHLPLSDKDPNNVEQRQTEKRERDPTDVQSRVQAAKRYPIRVFDETEAPATRHPKPTPRRPISSRFDDLVTKTAALAMSKTESDTSKPANPTDDSDVLMQMLHTLADVLEVAEARKYSYASSYVQPCSRGGPTVWVTRYVDYTSKYGLGFLLNDGSSGVYFNDSTKAVLEVEGETFQYIERKRVETREVGVRRTEPTCGTHTLSEYPETLQKKVTLLKHFRNYLIEQQKKADDDGSAINTVDAVASALPLTYLKKWVRTKHAILFRLSNQTVQIVFYDQTEVLLTPDERYITYVDKKRQRLTYQLNDELVGSNAEMAKRLMYAKEILHQLLTGQQRR
eukprot:CAMPEP_0116848186 /NCGR_PEP_ID=MMETSP0418-20121206/14852_1 /TAXON_ID=1158023 /ORGANISM="Astrosyne radiata, Strain 13vi08-1A" /LENGTH=360 /DNA_ID=CAMNT_0004479719 /DNA_START=36 /DNA_END=1119 /DNA_ORIENTATION=+